MVIHVLGNGVEGGPSRESGFRNVLTATVLEEVKEIRSCLKGAVVIALFSVGVEGAEILVKLLAGRGVAGQAVDFLFGIVIELSSEAEDFLGLGYLGLQIALVGDGDALSVASTFCHG